MSQLITKHRLFFLHIPRTGGTWICQALKFLNTRISRRFNKRPVHSNKKLVSKHFLLQHLLREEFGRWDTSFAFVRHPINYYEPVWSWLLRAGKRRTGMNRFSWHPFDIPYVNWNDDFNVWMKLMLSNNPGWVSHLFDMYVGPEGGEFVDYIGRTENLIDDFQKIIRNFGLASSDIQNIGKKNVCNPNIKWDKGLKEAVIAAEPAITRFYDKNFDRIEF